MTTTPTLALCIPAYRAEHCLGHLLDSARQQQPPFDEIVVCVDASPDRTEAVARELGATVVVNERNEGCSRSKNRALAVCSSDWVHFRDADDVLLPGFTAEAGTWMVLDAAPDVVMMGFEYRDFETDEVVARGIADDSALSADPIAYALTEKLPNCAIYKRSVLNELGGFDTDPRVLYNEDAAFHIKLALAGCRFRASSAVTSINWRRGGSMSAANPVACLLAHGVVVRRAAERAGPKYAEAIAGELWRVATGLAGYDEWDAVDSVLADAARLWPRMPPGQSRDFAILCTAVGARRAFRLRERFVRAVKPALRPHLRARLRVDGSSTVS